MDATLTVHRWNFGGGIPSVQCAAPLLYQIQAAAKDGFMRFRHGGVEVGGVLYGTRNNGTVHIRNERPLPIEYAQGPSFVLSAMDEANLKRLLQSATQDVHLRGMDVVGWYTSHTRRDAGLTAEDETIGENHFSAAGQVCMILKPETQNTAQVTVYIRSDDGSLVRSESHFEAPAAEIVENERSPVEDNGPAVTEVAATAAPPNAVPEDALSETAAEEPQAPPREPNASSRRPLFLAVLVAAVAAAVSASYFLNRSAPAGGVRREEPKSQPDATPVNNPGASAPAPNATATPPAESIQKPKAGRRRPRRARRRRSSKKKASSSPATSP